VEEGDSGASKGCDIICDVNVIRMFDIFFVMFFFVTCAGLEVVVEVDDADAVAAARAAGARKLRRASLIWITLQDTAAHCSTLQHTATHCNTLQHTSAHCAHKLRRACHIMEYTATRCNTLQHTAVYCSTLEHTAAHCSTLQHAAAHCIALQLKCTAAHCNCSALQ